MQPYLNLTLFQNEVINSYLDDVKNYSICISPTGSGKGIIIEEIILKSNQYAIIVVPLTALVRQTKTRLISRGIKISLSTDLDFMSSKVIVICPESLENQLLKKWINGKRFILFIDECHCIEEWGGSFRPSYYNVYDFFNHYKPEKSLWLSATLPRESYLKFRTKTKIEFRIFGSFSHPKNLSTIYLKCSPIKRQHLILNKLKIHSDESLFFCNTRLQAEKWGHLCSELKIKNFFYHAGLSLEERMNIENQLKTFRNSTIFATTAFGLGMDFKQFKNSILTFTPYNMTSLLQEFGRAGRGTHLGSGLLYWSESDFRLNSISSSTQQQISDQKMLRLLLDQKDEDKMEIFKKYFI